MKIGKSDERSKGDGWNARKHSDMEECPNESFLSNHLPLNLPPSFQFSFRVYLQQGLDSFSPIYRAAPGG